MKQQNKKLQNAKFIGETLKTNTFVFFVSFFIWRLSNFNMSVQVQRKKSLVKFLCWSRHNIKRQRHLNNAWKLLFYLYFGIVCSIVSWIAPVLWMVFFLFLSLPCLNGWKTFWLCATLARIPIWLRHFGPDTLDWDTLDWDILDWDLLDRDT